MGNTNYSDRLPKRTPVKFLTAVTYSHNEILQLSINDLKKDFGEIDLESTPFAFNHTNYYEKEMGARLSKQFFSFKELSHEEQLIPWKLLALEIEKKYSIEGKRQVNIDPAYLELAKLVVASTKNFNHRIFLGKRIYGDVQLMYRKNEFVFNEWTYPDYKSQPVIHFLEKVRIIYFDQLKHGTSHIQ